MIRDAIFVLGDDDVGGEALPAVYLFQLMLMMLMHSCLDGILWSMSR